MDPYWALLLFLIIMGVGFTVGVQGTLAAIQAGIDAQENHGVVVGFENRQAVVEYRVADQTFRCAATEKKYKLGKQASVLYKTSDPAIAVVGSFLDRALGYPIFTIAFSGGLGLVLMLTIQKIKAQMAAARNAAGHALAELPQPLEVPKIGTFTLDACRFSTLLGQKISLFLSATRPSELEDALNVARTLWQGQEGWGQRVLSYAVQRCCPRRTRMSSGRSASRSRYASKASKPRVRCDRVGARRLATGPSHASRHSCGVISLSSGWPDRKRLTF